jgi:hypothetical protein
MKPKYNRLVGGEILEKKKKENKKLSPGNRNNEK